MIRALVTGASGFIGRHVLAALSRDGAAVWALGRHAPAGLPPERCLGLADPGDTAAIEAALEVARPDIVLHLAGAPAAAALDALYRVNVVFGAGLMAAAARRSPPPRLVLAGSAAEYGLPAPDGAAVTEDTACRPATAYGITKLAQTLHALALRDAGLPVVVARLFNPVGAGMPEHLALGSFARQIAGMPAGGGVLATGDLDVERDFVGVRDVAAILLALTRLPEVPGIIDVCTGRATSLRRLVEALVAADGRPITLRQDPARRGVTTLRRHQGTGRRLAALGLLPPPPDPDVLAREILRDLRHG